MRLLGLDEYKRGRARATIKEYLFAAHLVTERSAFSVTMQDNELPGYIAVGYSVQSDDSIGLVA
jgi:hypothetical protein